MDGIPVTLIVKATNQLQDQTIKCELSWTISRLKGYLSEVYECKPVSVQSLATITKTWPNRDAPLQLYQFSNIEAINLLFQCLQNTQSQAHSDSHISYQNSVVAHPI